MLGIEVRPTPEWERRLDNFGQKLSPQERKVARYVERNQQQFRDMTVKGIAAAVMVSEATVVRFCHRLGYEGLKEFKISVAADQYTAAVPSILQQDVPAALRALYETIHRYTRCLQDTALIDNAEAFDRAVTAIMGAKKLDLYGVGGSVSSMSFVRHMLIKVGIRVHECSNTHTQRLSAATLDKDDVVITISNRGESGELLQVIPLARKQGATVICITSRSFSSIAEMSDIVLWAAEGIGLDTISAPRVGINAILDAICHSIAQRRAQED